MKSQKLRTLTEFNLYCKKKTKIEIKTTKSENKIIME